MGEAWEAREPGMSVWGAAGPSQAPKPLKMRVLLICFLGGWFELGGGAGNCSGPEETKGQELTPGPLSIFLMK